MNEDSPIEEWVMEILTACAAEAGMSVEQLLADRTRKRKPAIARGVAMALLSEKLPTAGLRVIAELFGVIIPSAKGAIARVRHEARYELQTRRFIARVVARISPDPAHGLGRTAPQVISSDTRPAATTSPKTANPA